jgi:hypothetical protein
LKTCSWVIDGLILVLGLLPALFFEERYYKAASPARTIRGSGWAPTW